MFLLGLCRLWSLLLALLYRLISNCTNDKNRSCLGVKCGSKTQEVSNVLGLPVAGSPVTFGLNLTFFEDPLIPTFFRNDFNGLEFSSVILRG